MQKLAITVVTFMAISLSECSSTEEFESLRARILRRPN